MKRLLLRHFHERSVDLLWRERLTDREPEDARVEIAAFGKPPVRFVVLRAHPTTPSVGPCRDAERIQVGDVAPCVGEPGLLILQGDFRGNERHTTGALYETGDFAPRVFFNLAAWRVLRALIDPGSPERR